MTIVKITAKKSDERVLHLMYCPFVGLGLYGGWRGNRWLKNRIKIFKQFVFPSLTAQSSQDFVLWISWTREMRDNRVCQDFVRWLALESPFQVIHTYAGVCFWDDKYPDEIANSRLTEALHGSMPELTNIVGEFDTALMTLQPSDDCYRRDAVAMIQGAFRQNPELTSFGFRKGYIMRYQTGEIADYNPLTIPPFFTIKFKYSDFLDPYRHKKHTGPYKSHEYIAEHTVFGQSPERGFLVGTHGENISTVFDHPFKGHVYDGPSLSDRRDEFGLSQAGLLVMSMGWRKKILRRLPYKVQRKLRYVFGEKMWNKVYHFLRQ